MKENGLKKRKLKTGSKAKYLEIISNLKRNASFLPDSSILAKEEASASTIPTVRGTLEKVNEPVCIGTGDSLDQVQAIASGVHPCNGKVLTSFSNTLNGHNGPQDGERAHSDKFSSFGSSDSVTCNITEGGTECVMRRSVSNLMSLLSDKDLFVLDRLECAPEKSKESSPVTIEKEVSSKPSNIKFTSKGMAGKTVRSKIVISNKAKGGSHGGSLPSQKVVANTDIRVPESGVSSKPSESSSLDSPPNLIKSQLLDEGDVVSRVEEVLEDRDLFSSSLEGLSAMLFNSSESGPPHSVPLETIEDFDTSKLRNLPNALKQESGREMAEGVEKHSVLPTTHIPNNTPPNEAVISKSRSQESILDNMDFSSGPSSLEWPSTPEVAEPVEASKSVLEPSQEVFIGPEDVDLQLKSISSQIMQESSGIFEGEPVEAVFDRKPMTSPEFSIIDNKLHKNSLCSLIEPFRSFVDLTRATDMYLECLLDLKIEKFDVLPMNGIKKLNEASFSEVYIHENQIIKIMYLGYGDGARADFLREAAVNTILNGERHIIKTYKTHLIEDCYPKAYLRAWREYKVKKKSLNRQPPTAESLFGVIIMENGGTDLEGFKFQSVVEIRAVIDQLTKTLVRLEKKYKFEHRDLHWGNILIEKKFGLVYIRIIDFTLSRISDGQTIIYKDLETIPWLFDGDEETDEQFAVYRRMRAANTHWKHFRKSNLIWFRYILNKLLLKAQEIGKFAAGQIKAYVLAAAKIQELEEFQI